MQRNNNEFARGWFLKAEQDLKNIEMILDTNNPDSPYDTLCFHAQQASEKYLKGFIAFHGLPIPRTHDIEELLELCAPVKQEFSEIIEESAILSQYAVAVRYDFEFWPGRTEAEESLGFAQKIKIIILKDMPKDVNPSDS
ncbi:MAG: HEPN domain-containing protein [Candidatus Eremiobacteraeota bacterium]|nr:HEPN domain-containing protein [Candidatus Eremiobacteraeota bacterium]